MSKTEMIGMGVLGGVLGAGIVLGVAGGAMHYQNRHGGLRLPMTLEMQTNASTPSLLHVYACISRHGHRKAADGSKKCMATLTIEPFRVMAAGAFSAVTAMPVLPISCVPVADAAPVKAVMYGADGTSTAEGTLAVGANGAIVLTAPAASVANGAWGLARPVRISYEVAEM